MDKPKITYNKLVRDGIPTKLTKLDLQFSVRELSDAEFIDHLKAKIIEEAKEISTATPENLAAEIADLMTVVDSLVSVTGLDRAQIDRIKEEAIAKKGGFANKIFLEWAEDDGYKS